MKVLSIIFALFLSFLLIQCSDPPVNSPADQTVCYKGPGGGGHTETATNNLSFPALLADGFSLAIIDTSFLTPYAGEYEGLTAEEIAWLEANGPWYAQKESGNVWQGPFASYSAQDSIVAFIDWGDAMESVDPKLRRPYRVEFGVYVHLAAPMDAYTMGLLAFPSSPDETQGTNKTTYACNYATVASPLGKCVIQKFTDATALTWNASLGQWDGAESPQTGFGFAQELNVGGKYIFGASTGGWKPSELGDYRITFYFDVGSEVSLANAQPGDYNNGAPIIPKIGENNTAVVDGANNLTYMDVTVTGGGGGGGGGH